MWRLFARLHLHTARAAVLSETDTCLGVKRGKWSTDWSNTRILSLLNALWCMNTNFPLCERTMGWQNAFQHTSFQFQWLITRFVGCFHQSEGFPISSCVSFERDRDYFSKLFICTQTQCAHSRVEKLKCDLIKIVKWPSAVLIRFEVRDALTTCSILLFIIGL